MIELSKVTKLNCDEICTRRLQKILEGTEPKWRTSSCQVGLAGPTTMPLGPPVGFFHALLEYSSTAS
jgi:hypothetical protein